MLKFFMRTGEAVRHLRSDERGVVSFEYVIVVFCIVGAVSLVFRTDGGTIKDVLSTSVSTIAAMLPS
jgi:pilus assembly protein Flp/PilA